MDNLTQINYQNISNQEIRDLSWSQLKGNWTNPVLAVLLYLVLISALGFIPIPGTTIGPFYDIPTAEFKLPILETLLGGAFGIGIAAFHLKIARRRKEDINDIFAGFKQFVQAVIASFLILLIVLIGYALLIVPGIIAWLGLSQTYFIMADSPGISATDAMRQSWSLTEGHRMDFFMLGLSFFGWILLALLFTCGIGLLWVIPYMYVSYSHFYIKIKGGEDGGFELEDHLINEVV